MNQAADANKSAVSIRSLTATYDEVTALTGIDLDIPAGQLVTVVGPNGAGKSTLFKVIVGIITPAAGEIRLFGKPAERARIDGEIAYMPQQEQIDWDFPASVHDIVLSARFGHMRHERGLRRFLPPRMGRSNHHDAIRAALDAVDMLDYRDRAIGALSGGQKKRALLARALAQDARVLLLDEPLTGVDRASEALIMQALHKSRDEGRTIITVTHDLVSARAHADHVILINRSVVADGPRDEMLTDEMLTRTAAARWIGSQSNDRAEGRYHPAREPGPGVVE